MKKTNANAKTSGKRVYKPTPKNFEETIALIDDRKEKQRKRLARQRMVEEKMQHKALIFLVDELVATANATSNDSELGVKVRELLSKIRKPEEKKSKKKVNEGTTENDVNEGDDNTDLFDEELRKQGL